MRGKEIVYEIDENGCWICTSHARSSDGHVTIRRGGVRQKLHRYFYKIYKGDFDEKLIVRHTCDIPFCINPDHLILGTHQDNIQDRVLRNRSAKGIYHGRSKLTEIEVLEIFNDNNTPITHLAKKYKVDPKNIRNIKNKKIWQYLTKEL